MPICPQGTSAQVACAWVREVHVTRMHMCAGSPATPDQEQRHYCEHELHDESDQQNNPDGIQCVQVHGRCGELTYTLTTLALCVTVYNLAAHLLSQIASAPGRD